MHRAFLVLAIVSLTFASTARAAEAGAKKPNVIIFLADDLGYADVGAQQLSKDVRTPNIDSIAKGGVRFTDGYVSCPVCAPTRAGLLTGRYQQRFGFEQNPSPKAPLNFGLPPDQVTLAKALKEGGYATGMVGKWHLGFKPEHHPQARGFDAYYGFLAGAHDYNQVKDGRNAVLRGREPVEQITYMTDDFAREASAFVERHAKGDKPFFLYLAFNAVHTPMQAPQKYLERFAGVTDEKRRTLLAMLSAMDDAVGRVLERVRAAGAEENTLIVFLSDNGGPTPGNTSRNEPFSGFKNNTREGGIRVPFMVQWKGKIPAGGTYEKMASSLDLFPTVLAAAGIEQPRGQSTDGVDLMPFITGRNDAAPHETLYWRYGEKWAIRDQNYKLVHAEAGEPKLYDLAKDPGEKNDLSASEPETLKRLKAKYEQWSGELPAPAWKDFREKPLGEQGQRRRRRAGQGAGE